MAAAPGQGWQKLSDGSSRRLPVGDLEVGGASAGAVALVEPGAELSGGDPNWPTRAALMELLEERTVEHLTSAFGSSAADRLCSLLGTSPTAGLAGDDIGVRQQVFGVNAFAQKKLQSYFELVWDGLHDMTIILLLVMSLISFVVETLFGDHPQTGWIESVAIVVSVAIIVNVQASTDYMKERTFQDLSAQLDRSNKKVVTRSGVQMEVTDAEIVVGDLLSFNSHNLASIPCDGLLLQGTDVKMDEAALTGEPEPQVRAGRRRPRARRGAPRAHSRTVLAPTRSRRACARACARLCVSPGEERRRRPLHHLGYVGGRGLGQAARAGRGRRVRLGTHPRGGLRR